MRDKKVVPFPRRPKRKKLHITVTQWPSGCGFTCEVPKALIPRKYHHEVWKEQLNKKLTGRYPSEVPIVIRDLGGGFLVQVEIGYPLDENGVRDNVCCMGKVLQILGIRMNPLYAYNHGASV